MNARFLLRLTVVSVAWAVLSTFLAVPTFLAVVLAVLIGVSVAVAS